MENTYRYVVVEWIHDFEEQPITIYSEIDEEGWETRKVELFRDGTLKYASETLMEGTELGEVAFPPLEEIAESPEFKPRWITENEFEAIWNKALNQAKES